MKVVTWNVNSVRARSERVGRYLETRSPDVLCIQETKVQDEAFPKELFTSRGYEVEFFGQKTYNGVAIATRGGLAVSDVVRGLPGDGPEAEKRVIAATVGSLRVINLYVVNGQAVGSEKFAYKLAWLARVRDFVEDELRRHAVLVVCGDFNIAPEDKDVFDPVGLKGTVLLSEEERAAFAALTALGLRDSFRHFNAEPGHYSWWDYRMLGFPKNRGYRIDFILASDAALGRARGSLIDREERKGEGASDHAPVSADFAEA